MQQKTEIFSILYEVNAQRYLIGVTNEDVPRIASMGVNTQRPLPINIRTTLIAAVKELKNLNEEPRVIDYNAPSSHASVSLLGNFSVTPIGDAGKPAKTIEEVLVELEKKIIKSIENENKS